MKDVQATRDAYTKKENIQHLTTICFFAFSFSPLAHLDPDPATKIDAYHVDPDLDP
jgi:hypothetical protein